MGRKFMIGASLLATVLFMVSFERADSQHWIAWILPMVLIVLTVINYLCFTRLVAWIIFSVAFFAFLVVLSAFTLRWRLESGFEPVPFYQTIFMYIAFIYVSLAQIKILGNPVKSSSSAGVEEKNEK